MTPHAAWIIYPCFCPLSKTEKLVPKIKSCVNTSSLWGGRAALWGRITHRATVLWLPDDGRKNGQRGMEATRCICPLSGHLKACMKPNKLQLIAFPNNGGIRVEAQRRRRVGTPDGTTAALLKMDATEINTWKVRQTGLTSHLVTLRFPLKRAPESRSGSKTIRKPTSVTSHLSCS